MSNFNHLIVESQDGVVSLTINRPEVGNAFDGALIKELLDTLETLKSTDIRLLVLKSSGKHFSTGADLNWMKHARHLNREENLADAHQLAKLLRQLNTFPCPTLAVVQGAAYGGAVGLVSACDMAIGTDSARFCLSEVRVGLAPAVISPYVIAAIGLRQARRYILSAEMMSSEQALSIGLIHECCTDQQLKITVEQIIQDILLNSPGAMKEAKSLMLDIAHRPIDQPVIDKTCESIARIRVSAEGQEGVSAFLEKRKPLWQ